MKDASAAHRIALESAQGRVHLAQVESAIGTAPWHPTHSAVRKGTPLNVDFNRSHAFDEELVEIFHVNGEPVEIVVEPFPVAVEAVDRRQPDRRTIERAIADDASRRVNDINADAHSTQPNKRIIGCAPHVFAPIPCFLQEGRSPVWRRI